MNANLSRRSLFKTAGVTAAGVALTQGLTACGSSGGSGKTTLRFMWYGAADRQKRFMKAIKLYEKRNPKVTISPEFGDIDAATTRLQTQIAGGNAPDIFWPLGDTADYTKRGLILDLGPYIGHGLDLSGIDKATLADGQWQGKQYAVAHGLQSGAVFSDEEVLKQLGLDIPEYPKYCSWDDYAAICLKIHQKKGAKFFGTDDPTYSGASQFLRAYARQHGQEYYKENGDIGFSKDTLTSWFQYWAGLRKSGAAITPQLELEKTPYFDGAPMIRGLAAFHMRNSNQMLELQGLTKHPLALHPVPVVGKLDPSTLTVDSNLVCISARTKYKDEAVKFLDFLINDPDRAKIIGTTIGAPATAKLRQLITPLVSKPEKLFLQHIDYEAQQKRRPVPKSPPGATEFQDSMDRISQNIAYGKTSVKDAVSDVFGSTRDALLKANGDG